MIKNLLSIAGSDSSGSAGIQADLKSFAARGTYGMSVITALTAQNTRGVTAVHVPDAAFLRHQLDAVINDIKVDAIKIGMIATADIANTICDWLETLSAPLIVLDPVMIAKGGSKLLSDDAIDVLISRLLRQSSVVTPNLPEAAHLNHLPIATTRHEMEVQASALISLGAKAVLLKGGHLASDDSPDLIATDNQLIWLEGERLATKNTHGTGCSLSSALAAELAKGAGLEKAARDAKQWLQAAILRNDELTVGSGHGPVHHFHEFW